MVTMVMMMTDKGGGEKEGGRRILMSLLKSYVVSFSALLAGASAVHYVMRPDLNIPDIDGDATSEERRAEGESKESNSSK